MERLTASMAPAPQRPVKVLQFGEGNFLRAFVDYFIDIANERPKRPMIFLNIYEWFYADVRFIFSVRKDGRSYNAPSG